MVKAPLLQQDTTTILVPYLCGVPISELQEVSKDYCGKTMKKNELRVLVEASEDPLVKYYDTKKQGNRARNAAHFFLTFKGEKPKPTRLVDKRIHHPAYLLVKDKIYDPLIESAKKQAARKKSFIRDNPYDYLVREVIGLDRAIGVYDYQVNSFFDSAESIVNVEEALVDVLVSEINAINFPQRNKLLSKVQQKAVNKYLDQEFPWTQEKKDYVHDRIGNLNDEDQDLINKFLGIQGNEKIELEAIAEQTSSRATFDGRVISTRARLKQCFEELGESRQYNEWVYLMLRTT